MSELVEKSKIKCKNCRKLAGDHKAKSFNCPYGRKHMVMGYTSYSQHEFFEANHPKQVTNKKSETKNDSLIFCPNCHSEFSKKRIFCGISTERCSKCHKLFRLQTTVKYLSYKARELINE